jgi:hypothetical protein
VLTAFKPACEAEIKHYCCNGQGISFSQQIFIWGSGEGENKENTEMFP